jgi:hypothetical protein
MNFAMALTAGRVKGTQVDINRILGSPTPLPEAARNLAILENSLLAGDVSKQTHDTIAARLEDPKVSRLKLDGPAGGANVGAIAGLLLGSPEFQKR